jgi:addiction module RelE/StbE family toxin
MKIAYTEAALADLDEIFEYLEYHYPTLVEPVQERIQTTLARLQQWPKSARKVDQRTDVRVVPLIRYPYLVFYRITDDAIEIVHIRHASRRPWVEDE